MLNFVFWYNYSFYGKTSEAKYTNSALRKNWTISPSYKLSGKYMRFRNGDFTANHYFYNQPYNERRRYDQFCIWTACLSSNYTQISLYPMTTPFHVQLKTLWDFGWIKPWIVNNDVMKNKYTHFIITSAKDWVLDWKYYKRSSDPNIEKEPVRTFGYHNPDGSDMILSGFTFGPQFWGMNIHYITAEGKDIFTYNIAGLDTSNDQQLQNYQIYKTKNDWIITFHFDPESNEVNFWISGECFSNDLSWCTITKTWKILKSSYKTFITDRWEDMYLDSYSDDTLVFDSWNGKTNIYIELWDLTDDEIDELQNPSSWWDDPSGEIPGWDDFDGNLYCNNKELYNFIDNHLSTEYDERQNIYPIFYGTWDGYVFPDEADIFWYYNPDVNSYQLSWYNFKTNQRQIDFENKYHEWHDVLTSFEWCYIQNLYIKNWLMWNISCVDDNSYAPLKFNWIQFREENWEKVDYCELAWKLEKSYFRLYDSKQDDKIAHDKFLFIMKFWDKYFYASDFQDFHIDDPWGLIVINPTTWTGAESSYQDFALSGNCPVPVNDTLSFLNYNVGISIPYFDYNFGFKPFSNFWCLFSILWQSFDKIDNKKLWLPIFSWEWWFKNSEGGKRLIEETEKYEYFEPWDLLVYYIFFCFVRNLYFKQEN